MATLSVQQITPAGLEATFAAAAGGGDKVRTGDDVFLEVVNGGGSDITVTINDPTSSGPAGATQFNPDVAVVVTAGERRHIGPVSHRFRDPADGLAAITYSGVTSVTIAALAL